MLIDFARRALDCRDSRWLATTGVTAPRALPRRFTRSRACAAVLIGGYTIQDTRRRRRSRSRRNANGPSGTSGTSTPSEARRAGGEPPSAVPAVVGIMVADVALHGRTYARTASSFDNPDFVDVVIHRIATVT